MGKDKLARFAELETLPNTIQPKLKHWADDFELKGLWHKNVFGNDNPIVLEIGCGKGEYTVGLSRQYPEKNFIGIDRKGARIWRGAKTAKEEGIDNARFLRIHVEKIPQFFAPGEVSEIWITFPDPQPQKSRARKRLTSPIFLNRYKYILKQGGIIHLKTDSRLLYDYTLEVIREEGHKLLFNTDNLYSHPENQNDPILGIRTYYEGMFLEQGLPLNYLKFELNDLPPTPLKKDEEE